MQEKTVTTEEVLKEIQTLYGGPHDQQKIASSWLNDFSGTMGAWQTGLELLGGNTAVEVQFFAANMLFNKARRDFGRLQPSERASLLTLIR